MRDATTVDLAETFALARAQAGDQRTRPSLRDAASLVELNVDSAISIARTGWYAILFGQDDAPHVIALCATYSWFECSHMVLFA